MNPSAPVRTCLLIVLSAIPASAADENTWTLRGTVLDEQGLGIPAVELSPYWAASSAQWEDVGPLVKAGNGKALWAESGRMQPWGSRRPVATNNDGRFSVELNDLDHWVLAMDKERRRGAVVTVDPEVSPADLKVTLHPLVKVRGIVRLAGTKRPVQSSCVAVRKPLDSKFPLARGRLALCCSDKSQFEILLPPGEYELEGNNDETLDTFRAETAAPLKITVPPGTAELDVGTLELSISTQRHLNDLIVEAKRKGTFGDYRKHYGKEPPHWHIADVRGVKKDAQIANFKGRWVALYFWGPNCTPCLKNGIPNLIKFDEEHSQARDRFVILSFCLDYRGEFKTIADLDKNLEDVVKHVWGKQPSFPLLLDNSFATFKAFGLEAVGDLLLIDPEGRLVEGDLETLSARLRQP